MNLHNGNKHIQKSNGIALSLIHEEFWPTGDLIYDALDSLRMKVCKNSRKPFGWRAIKITPVPFNHNIDSDSMPVAELRRAQTMNQLYDWQKALVNSITEHKEAKKIILFDTVVRVIVDNPTEETSIFSKLYIKFLRQHPDLNIDFLVFANDEIDNDSYPEKATIINCE